MSLSFDVLIVGYGPAGATAANLLGQRGFSVAVVETMAAIYDKPRAITADQEVMRVFQECGLAEDISRNTCPHPGTNFIGLQGQIIKRFYPQPSQPLAWETSWQYVQPEVEAVLRQGVARFPQVQVFLEHEFVGLAQSNDSVSVQVRRLSDGARLSFNARYVIASDGARSTVRRQLNAPIEDLAFDEWWIVVDAHLRGEDRLPERAVQYCRPSRPGTYMVGPGKLRRWEIKMLPGETPGDFESEAAINEVWSTFTDISALELWRSAIYRFHALVVDQWRFGRVFLMGDAAHQMPPFLGQGLCAAIRDAVNLAWKLEAVERHGASPALLDSYGEERKPHVRTIVAHAKAFGLIIGELDEAKARERDERLGAELASGRAETVRQKFIPGLVSGLIARDAQQKPQTGAGALFVQPWVRAHGEDIAWQRLDDLTGPKFLLVSDAADALDWLDGLGESFWLRIGGKRVLIGDAKQDLSADFALRERDGVFAAWLQELGAKVVLVRPDHYVYGVANSPLELRQLLSHLEGALSLS